VMLLHADLGGTEPIRVPFGGSLDGYQD